VGSSLKEQTIIDVQEIKGVNSTREAEIVTTRQE